MPEETPAVLETILTELRLIRGCLERMEARTAEGESSVELESAAVLAEPPDANEPLPTWILTDQQVARIEEAIVAEQRVRGRAYGGP